MLRIITAIASLAICTGVYAKGANWDLIGHDEETKKWFRGLVQPDTIGRGGPASIGGVSCCGESDAYYADETHVRDGKIFAVITDDRDDGPLNRAHEKIGTEYEVPPQKIVGQEQYIKGNPTGHIVIFLGGPSYDAGGERLGKRSVLCYVPNGGV